MSTTHKFRVWDGEEMHEPPHDYVIASDGCVCELTWDSNAYARVEERTEVAVMPYTGLDDAEDTPIYEGDVVEYKLRRGDSQRGCVLYRAGKYVVGPNGGAYLRLDVAVTDPDWETTVIGNKSEDSDLLETEETM